MSGADRARRRGGGATVAGATGSAQAGATPGKRSRSGSRYGQNPATPAAGGANSAQKKAALSEHKSNQDRVAKFIAKGLALTPAADAKPDDPDLVFRNTCQWIQAGNCKLVVLSWLHDAFTRKQGRVLFFDQTVLYPNLGGDYPEPSSVLKDPRMGEAPPSFRGVMSRNKLYLFHPSKAWMNDTFLRDLIVHEVQHDADQSGAQGGNSTWAVSGAATSGAKSLQSRAQFNGYQTEFRAYWIGTPEGAKGDAYGSSTAKATNSKPVVFTDPLTGLKTSVATKFGNQRQEKIWWKELKNYPDEVKHYATDPVYKQMVDDYVKPIGGNLINSVRIQAVSDALKACKTSTKSSAPEAKALMAAAGKLDASDRGFLKGSSASPFWTQATASLSPKMLMRLSTVINGTTPVGDFGPLPGRSSTQEGEIA